jgi:maleylpyruvate isomerase
MMTPRLTLYGYWRSSSSWRVRIALHHKSLAYTDRPVHLVRGGGEQHQEGYAGVNALREVPVLEIEDPRGSRRLTQSMAIIDYLERLVPEPALLPDDPWLAARARQLAEIVNAGIQPLQNRLVLDRIKLGGGDEAASAWARHFIARGLTTLEAAAAETAGAFLVGEAVTLADVYLVPQLYNARRFNLDLAPYPTLLRAEQTCQALPAFTATHPDRQPDAEPA